MVINPIVGVYIPITWIPIKGGMTIPNIATFDHGTYVWTPTPPSNSGKWKFKGTPCKLRNLNVSWYLNHSGTCKSFTCTFFWIEQVLEELNFGLRKNTLHSLSSAKGWGTPLEWTQGNCESLRESPETGSPGLFMSQTSFEFKEIGSRFIP